MLSDERKAATKAALRAIAQYQASRKAPPEFKEGTAVVIALDDELAADVFARVTSHEPPVIVAVYFPRSGGVGASVILLSVVAESIVRSRRISRAANDAVARVTPWCQAAQEPDPRGDPA